MTQYSTKNQNLNMLPDNIKIFPFKMKQKSIAARIWGRFIKYCLL